MLKAVMGRLRQGSQNLYTGGHLNIFSSASSTRTHNNGGSSKWYWFSSMGEREIIIVIIKLTNTQNFNYYQYHC